MQTQDDTSTSDSGGYDWRSGESGRLRPGGIEQYTTLVVPPEVNQRTGGEKADTAKVVHQGRMQDFQRNKPSIANADVNVGFGLIGEEGAGEPSPSTGHGKVVGRSPGGVASPMRIPSATQRIVSPGATQRSMSPRTDGGKPRSGSSPGPQQAQQQQPQSARSKSPQKQPSQKGGHDNGREEGKGEGLGSSLPDAPVVPPSPSKVRLARNDPTFQSLRSSITVPFVPVKLGDSAVPHTGLSSTAQVISSVRHSVEDMFKKPLKSQGAVAATKEDRVLQQHSNSGASMGSHDTQTSYTGGKDLSTPGNMGAYYVSEHNPVPLVKVRPAACVLGGEG